MLAHSAGWRRPARCRTRSMPPSRVSRPLVSEQGLDTDGPRAVASSRRAASSSLRIAGSSGWPSRPLPVDYLDLGGRRPPAARTHPSLFMGVENRAGCSSCRARHGRPRRPARAPARSVSAGRRSAFFVLVRRRRQIGEPLRAMSLSTLAFLHARRGRRRADSTVLLERLELRQFALDPVRPEVRARPWLAGEPRCASVRLTMTPWSIPSIAALFDEALQPFRQPGGRPPCRTPAPLVTTQSSEPLATPLSNSS